MPELTTLSAISGEPISVLLLARNEETHVNPVVDNWIARWRSSIVTMSCW